MSLIVIFGGILGCILAYVFKWNKGKNVLLIAVVLLVTSIGVGVAPNYLLNKLQDGYESRMEINWSNSNVIVLLGAGTEKLQSGIEPTFFSYSRISETARLYNDCAQSLMKCMVIVSGGDAFNNGESESEVYKRYLLDLGVVEKNIIEESESMNTWQNAQFTSHIIKQKSYDRVILVTSGLHLQRSDLYFSHFGVDAIPVRSDHIGAKLSMIPSWYNFAVMDLAIHEWLGFYRYYFYNYMGWNPTRVKPGQA